MARQLFLLFLLIPITSCAHTGIKPNVAATLYKQSAFLFMEARHTKICLDGHCIPKTVSVNGSGVLIRKLPQRGMVGLTAAHLCDAPFKGISFTQIKVTAHDGRRYDARVIKSVAETDICIFYLSEMKEGSYLRMSETPPQVGDPAHTLSAPLSIFSPGASLIFKGYFSGRLRSDKDGYTIPTAPGSSGSPILNSHGRIIGMTSARFLGFENFCISPSYQLVKDMMDLAYEFKPPKGSGL